MTKFDLEKRAGQFMLWSPYGGSGGRFMVKADAIALAREALNAQAEEIAEAIARDRRGAASPPNDWNTGFCLGSESAERVVHSFISNPKTPEQKRIEKLEAALRSIRSGLQDCSLEPTSLAETIDKALAEDKS